MFNREQLFSNFEIVHLNMESALYALVTYKNPLSVSRVGALAAAVVSTGDVAENITTLLACLRNSTSYDVYMGLMCAIDNITRLQASHAADKGNYNATINAIIRKEHEQHQTILPIYN